MCMELFKYPVNPLTQYTHAHTWPPTPHPHTHVGMCVHMHKEMCYENDTDR